MTVQTTTTRADYTGNGVTTAFTVPFYFLDNTHLQVLRTQISTGAVTTLALTTDYTVSGAGVGTGGTLTCLVAPTSDQKISILRNVPQTQLIHYVPNDPFPAATHEQALDQLTMEVQQVSEAIGRALTLSANTTGVSGTLPSPQSSKLIGWNQAATGLQNVDPSSLLTIAGSSGFSYQTFTGDGSTKNFTLSANPGAIANLEIALSGVLQTPTADYTVSGTTLTFVTAPGVGVTILARWGTTLGIGVPSDTSVTTSKMVDGSVTTSKMVDGSVTTSKMVDGSVTTAKLDPTGIAPIVTSVNGGQLAGLRNKIINGGMDIAQRGTSFAAIASGSYSLDRYLWQSTSAAVLTISQQADVPSDNEFQNSLRIAVTTADASIAATDIGVLQQRIEGYNVRDLISKTFTLSFQVRSSKTGIHCVAFKNSGLDRAYVAEYTINAANTWETKTITVSGGLITAGTWNWTTGGGLYISWPIAAGTNFQTTAGAWQTGDYYATANQVNVLDTVGNIFAITGVQLEVGAVATPFEHRPYGMELALCQRYYERGFAFSYGSVASLTSDGQVGIRFRVEKRATPTMSAISGVSLTNAVVEIGTAFKTPTGFTFTADTAGVNVSFTGITYAASFRPIQLGTDCIQASAEL